MPAQIPDDPQKACEIGAIYGGERMIKDLIAARLDHPADCDCRHCLVVECLVTGRLTSEMQDQLDTFADAFAGWPGA